MKIGIDISQLAFANTGVANYLESLLISMLAVDDENEYILFYSSLRAPLPNSIASKLFEHKNTALRLVCAGRRAFI